MSAFCLPSAAIALASNPGAEERLVSTVCTCAWLLHKTTWIYADDVAKLSKCKQWCPYHTTNLKPRRHDRSFDSHVWNLVCHQCHEGWDYNDYAVILGKLHIKHERYNTMTYHNQCVDRVSSYTHFRDALCSGSSIIAAHPSRWRYETALSTTSWIKSPLLTKYDRDMVTNTYLTSISHGNDAVLSRIPGMSGN